MEFHYDIPNRLLIRAQTREGGHIWPPPPPRGVKGEWSAFGLDWMCVASFNWMFVICFGACNYFFKIVKCIPMFQQNLY